MVQPPRLLDQVRFRFRFRFRFRHYSIRTEQAYLGWIRRFVLFHGKQHPSRMGETRGSEVFRSYLTIEKQVAASTQNQAKSALLFLYRASNTGPGPQTMATRAAQAVSQTGI